MEKLSKILFHNHKQRLEMFHYHPHSCLLTESFTGAFRHCLIQTVVTILQIKIQTTPCSPRHLKAKFLFQRALAGGNAANCHKVSCSCLVAKGISRVSLNGQQGNKVNNSYIKCGLLFLFF